MAEAERADSMLLSAAKQSARCHTARQHAKQKIKCVRKEGRGQATLEHVPFQLS